LDSNNATTVGIQRFAAMYTVEKTISLSSWCSNWIVNSKWLKIWRTNNIYKHTTFCSCRSRFIIRFCSISLCIYLQFTFCSHFIGICMKKQSFLESYRLKTFLRLWVHQYMYLWIYKTERCDENDFSRLKRIIHFMIWIFLTQWNDYLVIFWKVFWFGWWKNYFFYTRCTYKYAKRMPKQHPSNKMTEKNIRRLSLCIVFGGSFANAAKSIIRFQERRAGKNIKKKHSPRNGKINVLWI
jgi:hypothetical protein